MMRSKTSGHHKRWVFPNGRMSKDDHSPLHTCARLLRNNAHGIGILKKALWFLAHEDKGLWEHKKRSGGVVYIYHAQIRDDDVWTHSMLPLTGVWLPTSAVPSIEHSWKCHEFSGPATYIWALYQAHVEASNTEVMRVRQRVMRWGQTLL